MNIQPRTESASAKAAARQYRKRHRAQMVEFGDLLPAYAARYSWSRAQVTAERDGRLRRLLSIAKTRSPWHAKRLAHIDVEKASATEIRRLPTMTKAELMANFDAALTDRRFSLALVKEHIAKLKSDAYLLGSCHAITTSGSSGMHGFFVYDWRGWIEMGLSSARVVSQMGVVPGVDERLASLAALNPSHGSAAFTQSFAPWLSTAFKRFASLPVTLPFAEIIEGLNTLQPTRISGFPSIIYQLCGAARRGQLRITPKSFLVGAEPLYPEVRLALEEQFKAKVHNFYGCSEASCLAFSCPAGPGLHLSDDLVIVEPVDERGEPVPIGVPSAKVLLTNLFNTLQPLIRYELADSITLLQSQTPCICGSSFRKIDDVQGRSDDSFLYASGVFAHPIIFTEPLCHEPLIQEYQVHQTRAGAHILLRSAEMFDAAALQARIVARLRLLGLKEPEITTQFVERIERNSGGKLRQFVRLVPDSI